MALDRTDRDFLRTLYRDLKPDVPLEPGSPFYEPIYQEEHRELGLEDPVERIATLIDFDGGESIRLFSGFRGSGKTTELKRLQQALEEDGYFVLYADALEYVNAAEPIEIGELLVAVAGAFGESLERELGKSVLRESYWERARRFLQSDATLTDATLKTEVGVTNIAKAGLDLKFEIKSPTTFKQILQKMLASRLKELQSDANAFFEDCIKTIRKERGNDIRVVFIFDQLEQLRGTLQTEQIVIQSVQRIFSNYIDLLRIPYVHVVYTVPPWLKFVLPGTVQITLLSTVHLWNNNPARDRCDPAWSVFRSMVRRRFGPEGLTRVFGADAEAKSDRLIDMCGGHFRDLLRLLQDSVVRATSQTSLPVSMKLIEDSIAAARRDFLPIAQNDAKWLADIARVRATALPSTDATPVNRLARFLDSHSVLYFVNAEEWYDIHPLIREEVETVLQATTAASA